MARALWSGSIEFGLVNAPVRMFPAVAEHRLEFNLVHVQDGSLLDVIETKRRGGSVAPERKEKREAAPDLLQALQESVERARGGNGRPSRGGGSSALGKLTVKQLNARARKLGLEGRSTMTKRELVSAIKAAEN